MRAITRVFVLLMCLGTASITALRAAAARLLDDGQIAFIRDGGWSLHLVDVRSGLVLRLARDWATSVNDILWLPDGEHLLFRSVNFADPSGAQRLATRMYRLSLHHRAITPLDQPPPCNHCRVLDVAPTGEALLYNDGSGSRVAYIYDLATGQRRDAATGYDVDWSPDGARLAAMLIGDDGRPTLYLVDAVTRAAIQCRYGGPGILIGSPAWSPDGKRIVMLVETSGSPVDLMTFAADGADCGSDPLRLTHSTGGAFGPSWSPDGRLIAYICPDPAYTHLCVVPAAGGEPRQITFHLNAGLPNWRPR